MADPGWYQDPNGQWRWWDGQRWTEHVQPAPPPAPGGPGLSGAQPPPLPSEGQARSRGRGCLVPGLIVAGVLLIALVVAGLLAGGDDEDEPASPTTTAASDTQAAGEAPTEDCALGDGIEDTRNLCLYPDRPDRQEDDHEAELGASVRLAGYTATVLDAFIDQPEFGSPVLVVSVDVENRDEDSQPFNTFDWQIQTADGTVLDPTINVRDDNLGSGDLVTGGTASGTVAFDVGPGDYYVIYKPDPFNDARGIWRVTAQ